MVNIICVKIGTKFDHVFVNRLFEMCKNNITVNFQFICYTDDPTYIDRQIKIIDFIDNDLDIIVYNKLFLFSKEFHMLLGNDHKCVYFDLDIVIKHNIDQLITFNATKLAVIKARWKDTFINYMGFPHFDHNINSSCMIWCPKSNYHIWDKFNSYPEFYLTKYKNGMDPYLFYEHKQRGDLPREFFYSFMYGGDLKYTYWARDEKGAQIPHLLKDFFKPIPIVLFNGDAKNKIEKFLERYED